MKFISPTTLEEAYRALSDDETRCLAGGQSLVAMMNLGLVAPSRLVSLRKINSLLGIDQQRDGSVRIGAMTTHADVADMSLPGTPASLLRAAARVVGYPAIRMQGTIGGSVAHADPAADLPVALAAIGAEVEIGSLRGTRRVPAREFFRGPFETALAQDELVLAIVLPPPADDAGSAYEKLSLVAGDFAIVSVAAVVGKTARVAVGGCGPKPLFAADIDVADGALVAAGSLLADASDPPSDQRASAAYRRKVIPELVRRTVRAAQEIRRAAQ
ncbi:MAG: xanthine dehydrogenase family protein subunit M [Pseudorhodoplanes sp.]|uniref:FAD binding domain-containing protein n=1 Tax=Pseudorhodoplanes sp. TaxID=1934341 RepID=UPI003D0C257F